jgi:hypothetical protein
VSPVLQVSATEPFVVKFAHTYALEGDSSALFDGGVVELSSDGGASWADASTFGVDPGYDGPLFIGSDNPLGGRNAYSGFSAKFPDRSQVVLNFGTQLAGRAVQVRFRLGTDAAVAFAGWDIDDIDVSGITNTPFPSSIAEPSTCTARKFSNEDIVVVAAHPAPATSLDSFDSAVCIAADSP